MREALRILIRIYLRVDRLFVKLNVKSSRFYELLIANRCVISEVCEIDVIMRTGTLFKSSFWTLQLIILQNHRRYSERGSRVQPLVTKRSQCLFRATTV